MKDLNYVVVFTHDMDRMRQFYARGLGLVTGWSSVHWTDFNTRGAALALHPRPAEERREVQLLFNVPDLAAEMAALRGRGVVFDGDVREEDHGSFAQLRDPDGVSLCLAQPRFAMQERKGPALATVIVRCASLGAALGFYRDKLGLKVLAHEPHWAELDTGITRLALHARPAGADHPLHAAQPVTVCFETTDLDERADELRARGITLATAPTEEEFGLYAEVADPDGNLVVLRAPAEEASLEETLAEPFESDAAPRAAAIRKPLVKGASATSRLAVKPAYHEPRGSRAKARARPKRKAAAGAGKKPAARPGRKTARDATRARPAIGRQRKAERRAGARTRTEKAGASKTRPVKRAAVKAGRRAGRGRR